MKYSRGTYLKWTKKALNPRTQGAAQRSYKDRMIVVSHNEVAFVHEGVIEQLDMFKTQDSYVEPSGEEVPKGLKVDTTELLRCSGISLVKEFGLKITKTYQGRKILR